MHLENAKQQIDLTESEIFIFTKEVQLENAFESIELTVEGIVISLIPASLKE